MRLGTLNILVGNSEPVVCECLRALLTTILGEEFRLDVVGCSRLDGIVENAKSRQFDLCFLTINNVITGAKTSVERIAKVVGSIPELKATGAKVIASSSFLDTPEYREEVCRAGADCFIGLPFSHDEVVQVLEGCLGAGGLVSGGAKLGGGLTQANT